MKIKSLLRVLLFSLIVGGMIILFGCSLTKRAIEPQIIKSISPVPWRQDIDPYIEVGDPVNFFNEYQIDIYVKIPKFITVFHNGKIYNIDSSKTILIPIPALTMGKLTKTLRNNRGELIGMIVLFETENNNLDYAEELRSTSNYEFTFLVNEGDKTFFLEGKKQILFNEKLFDVKLRIHGNGTGFCRLLTDYYSVDRSDYEIIPASGVDPEMGTKIIKK